MATKRKPKSKTTSPTEDKPTAKRKVRLVRQKPKRKVRLVRSKRAEPAKPATLEAAEVLPNDVSDEQPLPTEKEADPVQDEGSPDPNSDGMRNMARSLVDAVMPDLVKRMMAVGGEALSEASVKTLLEETALPEDEEGDEPETKGLRGEFQRVLSREIQKFLGTVDLSGEIQKILTSLTFEVRTEIRFVSNADKVRPKIKNKVRIKRNKEET